MIFDGVVIFLGTVCQQFEAAMRRCISLGRRAARSGNYGLGALVVRGGEVIGESGSGLVEGTDPTAHPEVVALRMAARRMRSRYLPGAYLVTTLEPCPMCTAAAVWAKMRGIVYGAAQPDAVRWAAEHPHPTFTWRQIGMRARDVVRVGSPVIELHEGVCREACLELFALTGSTDAGLAADPGAEPAGPATPATRADAIGRTTPATCADAAGYAGSGIGQDAAGRTGPDSAGAAGHVPVGSLADLAPGFGGSLPGRSCGGGPEGDAPGP